MNKDTKKMAELLRQGNKMLNQSCPECNNPLFESQNEKIFCPVCNREVVIVENENDYKKLREKNSQPADFEQKNGEGDLKLKNIHRVIQEKIEFLITILESEKQVDGIEKIIDLIDKLYDLLKKTNQYSNN
jgi:uncharacterized Zn finger protein (UPF0148 family)